MHENKYDPRFPAVTLALLNFHGGEGRGGVNGEGDSAILKKNTQMDKLSSSRRDITLLQTMNNSRGRQSLGSICCLHFVELVLSSLQFYDNSSKKVHVHPL